MTKLEVLVEEQSAEAALHHLLPRILGPQHPYAVRVFQGKPDLLRKLPQRLKAYSRRLTREEFKIVVLLDRDHEDCVALKRRLEQIAANVGLKTPDRAGNDAADLINRIAVAELESWFLGDIAAIRVEYPRLSTTLSEKSRYRDPDAVTDAWEALERELQRVRYHRAGLPKVAVAQRVSAHMDVENNRSRSFQVFRDGLRQLAGVTDAQA